MWLYYVCKTILKMSEQEMMENQISTIYKLIDIHSSFHDPKRVEKQKAKIENETEMYIDNII